MRFVWRLLILAFLFATTTLSGERREALQWPSAEFRTLQSAIDAAPDGSTIEIKPGDHFVETPLYIAGRRLTFRGTGSGRRGGDVSHLIGPAPQSVTDERGNLLLRGPAVVGMFNISNSDVAFAQLQITGFDAGLTVKDLERARPSTLQVQDVVIARTGRGILAYTSGRVAVTDTNIEDTRWNGVSLVSIRNKPSALLMGVKIDVTVGFGIYFHDTFAFVSGSKISGALAGGIAGIRSAAWIVATALFSNHKTGILLSESTATITDNEIANSAAVNGFLGDGIALMQSSSALLTGNSIHDNQRSATSFFSSTGMFTNNTMKCNAFDIDVEDSGSVKDLGGNKCGCGQQTVSCQSDSSQLQPPQANAGVE